MRRKTVVAISLAVVLALAPGVGQADSGHGGSGQHGGRPVFTPGADGAGDPYFPLDGNGGYDVQHYDLDVKYDPETDVLTGEATIEARATQNLSALQPRLRGAHREIDQGRREVGAVEPRRWRTDHHTAAWDRQPAQVRDRRALRRDPRDDSRSAARSVRLLQHRRRGAGRRSTRCGRDLVPRQRSPARQGVVHVQDHRAGRSAGDRERCAEERARAARMEDMDVGRPRADGVVPRDDGDRQVRRARVP